VSHCQVPAKELDFFFCGLQRLRVRHRVLSRSLQWAAWQNSSDSWQLVYRVLLSSLIQLC